MILRNVCLRFTAVALLATAPLSLHADPTPDTLLVGTWEWVSSLDAWSGETWTPATAGYTMQLQFFADRRAIWFQDEQIAYTVTWEFHGNGDDPYAMLYIGNMAFVYNVTATELRLDDRFVDGSLMIFSRRQPVPLDASSWGQVKARFGSPGDSAPAP